MTPATTAVVFLGHQSVGLNVIEGIPGACAARGLVAPDVVDVGASARAGQPPRPAGSGYVVHTRLGRNGDAVSKIEDFDAIIRGRLGGEVDVAAMKLCYVDVTRGTDVPGLFARYRETVAALERDFPAVTFLHVTTPLTTEPGARSRLGTTVRVLAGRGAGHAGPADNVARERLNALMRREYDADRLFDLAAIESTAPDGTRVSGTYRGDAYFALYDGYAADHGHLNGEGATRAASRLLDLVARSGR